MPRKISIEIVGDSVSAERAFLKTSAAARSFSHSTNVAERDFSRMTRGVLSGSGVFHSLGRSLAFASGGFLAFGSAAEAIRKSIDAAETSEKALRSLDAQAKASGQSVRKVFGDVNKLEAAGASLGFNKADITQGFTVLLRGSGSAKKALQEMAAAENVARAKGVSLAEGAQLVNRVLVSNASNARALGVHFPKAASAAEKLQIILAKFAGQARANTTETDRFNATIFNTEEIVGRTLLPTLNKYLASLGNWLTKMDESGRLQRDVNTAVKDAAAVLHGVGAALVPVVDAFKVLKTVLGGTQHACEALGAAFVALKAKALLFPAATVRGGIFGIGAEATAASGEVAGLSGALTGLSAIGPIAIPITLAISTEVEKGLSKAKGRSFGVKDLSVASQLASSLGSAFPGLKAVGDTIRAVINATTPGQKTQPTPIQTSKNNVFEPGGANNALSQLIQKRSEDLRRRASQIPTPTTAQKKSLLQGQFNLDELKLAQAQAAGATGEQRKILVSEAVILKQLAAQAKTLKDRTSITQHLAGVEDQIRSIDSQALAASKKTADSAKKRVAAAKKAAEKAAKERASFSVPLELQVEDAKDQALGKSETSILNKIKAAAERALKSGKLGLQGQLDAWNEIASINSQLQSSAASALNGFKQADTRKLTAGLGLTPEALRALRGRLSQLGPGGTVPAQGVGAFGQIIGADSRPIIVHNHIHLDGKQIAKSTTRHQQKSRTRNPTQRRGAFAGGL